MEKYSADRNQENVEYNIKCLKVNKKEILHYYFDTTSFDLSLTRTFPAAHGIVCKDSLGSTKLTVDAGKDGIHCENTDDASLGFIYIGGAAR